MKERDELTAHTTTEATKATAVPTPVLIIPQATKYRCWKCKAPYTGHHKCPRRKEIGTPCY